MNQGLTLWGWLSLAAAWGVILVLTIYCFSRVLLAKKKKETGLGDKADECNGVRASD